MCLCKGCNLWIWGHPSAAALHEHMQHVCMWHADSDWGGATSSPTLIWCQRPARCAKGAAFTLALVSKPTWQVVLACKLTCRFPRELACTQVQLGKYQTSTRMYFSLIYHSFFPPCTFCRVLSCCCWGRRQNLAQMFLLTIVYQSVVLADFLLSRRHVSLDW